MSKESQKPQSSDTLRNLFISLAVAFGFLYVAQSFMPPPKAPSPTDGKPAAGAAAEQDAVTGDADQVTQSDVAQRASDPDGTGVTGGTGSVDGSQLDVFVVEAAETLEVVLGNTAPGDKGLVDTGSSDTGSSDTGSSDSGSSDSGSSDTNPNDGGSNSRMPTLADRESPYRSALVLTNVGAAIKSAYISDHTATLEGQSPYQLLRPIEGNDGNTYYSFAIETLDINGTTVKLADKRWTLLDRKENADGAEVSFSLLIQRFGEDAIRLIRTYSVPRQAIESDFHDVYSELRVENLSERDPQPITLTYRGGLGVSREATRTDDRVLAWGVRGKAGLVSGHTRNVSSIAKETRESLFDRSETDKLSWTASLNKYFSFTIVPLSSGSTWENPQESDGVLNVTAIDLDGDPATSNDVTVKFATDQVTINRQRAVRFPFELYVGEKNGSAFRTNEKYQSRNMYFQVQQSYGWCTFSWLVELMIWLLNSLHAIIGDFGLAIIIMVVIVRGILHPITKKGQVNMVRMQQRMSDFQPKIEELKKKYGNDRQRLQSETMKLYRDEGISPAAPLLGCLPMLLQMPIWIALFISLNNNILMRHEPFLFTWIRDLTGQDALFTFSQAYVVPILGAELTSFNLLPLLVGISMFIQQKLQPKPKPNPNMSEQQIAQQEMMQKMMPMMSIMMTVFFYKMPAGLNLYIMTSSLFGALEQSYIRNHIKQREESGTLHKPAKKGPSKGPAFVQRYVQRLQEMAEEAQKQQQTGGKGPRMKDGGGKKGRKGQR